ncbi:LamG domain-containing protein, partial [Candidatus Venteria ishoeyi]|uniref:LamG domain-containing protein n=1 Tax=Candidatus Venteria ishoeyi TaxID=1899563 RepID=UPI0011B0A4A7
MKRFQVIIYAGLLGLFSGLSIPVYADDTDLYRGQVVEISSKDVPNVLFVLDRSGSMGWWIDGKKHKTNIDPDEAIKTTCSGDNCSKNPKASQCFVDFENGIPPGNGCNRMEHLRYALQTLLTEMKNVNVGFATFTDGSKYGIYKPPIPIVYPIANVDSPATSLSQDDSGGKVSSQVSSAADDAEEALDGTQVGTVSLNDNILQMSKSDGVDGLDGSLLYAAHFQFEDNLASSTDPSHVGTLLERRSQSAVTPQYSDDGIIGKAAVFKDDRRIKIPMKDEMLFTTSGTIALWYNPGSQSHNEDYYLISRSDGADIKVTGSGLTWKYNLSESEGKFTTDDRTYRALKNEWLYLVVTGDQDGTHIYVNGELQKSSNIAMSIENSDDPWYVGSKHSDSGSAFGGLIDELIFDTNKWSAEEILANYEANKAAEVIVSDTEYENWPESDTTEYLTGGKDNESNHFKQEPGDINTDGNSLYAGNGECKKNKLNRCRGNTMVGLRFTDLPIPADAKIISATIELSNREYKKKGNTDQTFNGLKIQMQMQGDGAKPTSLSTSSKDLSSRLTFPEKHDIIWTDDISDLLTNHKDDNIKHVTTPDLTTLVTEAIKQGGWNKDNNAVVFLFSALEPSNLGTRLWHSTDSTHHQNEWPVLRVTWENPAPSGGTGGTGGTGGNGGTATGPEQNQLVGFRFQDVEVPQQATIKSASIEFTAAGNASGDALYQVSVEETGNARAFTSTAKLSARPILETIDWDASAQDWNAGSTYSVDVSELVQSAVNQGTLGKTDGWCGGNSMAFFVKAANGGE